MKKESVHLVATLLWGTYGITVGSIGVLTHGFNPYVMASVVTAIGGNSAHLISMSLSKTGLTETASTTNQKVN
ncbi:MAG: hypothetical protein QXU18_11005, partial [Thermoplasmatales archaeon]